MDVDWIVHHRICLLDSENPVTSKAVQRNLVRLGFTSVVTIRDYDYALIWRLADSPLRHYQCSFSDYAHPTVRDLHDLNEYCLYELAQDRSVPIWVEDDWVRRIVAHSLRTFFAFGMQDMAKFVENSMQSQRDRVLALPLVDKLTRCRFCDEGGCMTDWLCHATDMETAIRIVNSGRILSACQARQLPGDVLANEPRNGAGDPPDYFEYVMFGAGNCPAPDKLVYERTSGYVPSWNDFEAHFQPAVKFFFRTADLVKHPGFCTDGYHPVKIRDELTLEPLLAALVVPKELLRASELIELARKKAPTAKLVPLNCSNHSPREWAHTAYATVKDIYRKETHHAVLYPQR